MSEQPHATVVRCPSCGSSVSMSGAVGTCAYCGSTIERPGWRAQPASPPAAAPFAPPRPPQANLYRPRRRGAGGAVFLALVLSLGVAGYLFISPTTTQQISQVVHEIPAQIGTIVPGNPVATLTSIAETVNMVSVVASIPRDGPGADLLAVVSQPDGDGYLLSMIDGGTRTARWRSQPLSREVISAPVVVAGDTIYVADKTRLIALRASDGQPAWQTSLAVEPAPGCAGCLRVVKGRVVVLQRDGTLQAFETQTGQLAWSKRLDGTPRQLPLVGDLLVAVQPADKQSYSIDFLSPADGSLAQQITPGCQGSMREEHIDQSTPLVFTPDGGTLYLIFGFFDQCVQRWDVATGKAVWSKPIKSGVVPPTWINGSPPRLIDSLLVFGDSHTIYGIDTEDGALRPLLDEKEYNAYAVDGRDGTLVVLVSPTWDSSRWAVWGVDLAGGGRRWQYAVQGGTPQGFAGIAAWGWSLGKRGLTVVQVPEDQGQLIVETIDLKAGTSISRSETKLSERAGLSRLWELRWMGDLGVFRVGSTYYGLDTTSDKPPYRLS